MQEDKNRLILREVIKETDAIELMDSYDYEEEIPLDDFDEEGFEKSFFGESILKKKVSAVDVLIDNDFDFNLDDFDLDQLDNQKIESTVTDEFEEPDLDTADIAEFQDDLDNNEDFEEEFLPQYEQGADKNDWRNILKAELKFKPRFTLDIKLRMANDEVKEYYSMIKNCALNYGLHSRFSAKRENFSKSRKAFIRLCINGKTLKAFIAVDPNSLDKKHYRHKDVSHRKSTQLLPTMINVKSALAAKRICELMVNIFEENGFKLKKRYQPQNFAEQFSFEGYTKIQRCGYEYMLSDSYSRSKAHELPEFFAEKFINEKKIDSRPPHLIIHTVYLKELCEAFEPNSIVNLQSLVDKGMISRDVNYLRVKASDYIDRPLYIYCDDITPTAAKMVCLTKGQVFRLSTNKVDYLHLQEKPQEQADSIDKDKQQV